MSSLGNCLLGDHAITPETDSKEHILLQALGGRREVGGLLCRSCNTKSGDDWDVVLIKQLAHFTNMHGVSSTRSRTPRPVSVKREDGVELNILHDGSMAPSKPTYTVSETGNGTSISIVARTEEEARKMVLGVARKYPNSNALAMLENLSVQSIQNDQMLNFQSQVGGPESGRSIVKTAVSMAHWMGIPHTSCEVAVQFLRRTTADVLYGLFYERDLISNRPNDYLTHSVSVKGDPISKQLIAYVEYFSFARYVVLLSKCYEGQAIQKTYSINPADGTEIELNVNLDLSNEEIERATTGFGLISPCSRATWPKAR
jgi:HNH endonuclease